MHRFAEARNLKLAKAAARCVAAAERRTFHIRCRARTGLVALQGAAFRGRCSARNATRAAMHAAHAARCTAATTKRAGLLQARVVKASGKKVVAAKAAVVAKDLEAAVPTWEASGVATRNAATLAGARHATVATDEKHDEDGMKRFLDVLGGALDATVRGTVEATKTGWDKIAAAIANK